MNTESKSLELAAQLIYDQSFRGKVRNKDPGTLAKLGFATSDVSPELKVVPSTRDITYIAFPALPDNYQVSTAELGQLQAAGKTAGTVGSAGTASSAGSLCSTASTGGSAGTVGSAGSAGG